jgi:hypothetical protein
MSRGSAGAVTNSPLYFAGSREPDRAELVERKVCEGYGCGAMFYRPVPASAKEGEKLCAACLAREARMVETSARLCGRKNLSTYPLAS